MIDNFIGTPMRDSHREHLSRIETGRTKNVKQKNGADLSCIQTSAQFAARLVMRLPEFIRNVP